MLYRSSQSKLTGFDEKNENSIHLILKDKESPGIGLHFQFRELLYSVLFCTVRAPFNAGTDVPVLFAQKVTADFRHPFRGFFVVSGSPVENTSSGMS